jgi:uncharacterized DUF497 family protein
MKFEWNEPKNILNKKKHGVSFEIASFVFQDPFQLSVPDDRYSEERWQSIGLVQGTVIYVAHTVKDINHEKEIIRIISARAATTSEARWYYFNRKDEK